MIHKLPKTGLTLFHFSIWTYPQLLVLQIFIFSSGLTSDCQFFKFSFFLLPELTSECQFDCTLTLSVMFTWLDLHLWCQPCWYSLKNSDLFELSSSFRRSFWSFYRVQDPLSSCISILDMNTYIWCNVSCNVWLCMNEMSEHFLNFPFFSFFLYFFWIFPFSIFWIFLFLFFLFFLFVCTN